MAVINGERVSIVPQSIAAYLKSAGYNEKRVAVEKNLRIIPRGKWTDEMIGEDDSIEILNFVGGG